MIEQRGPRICKVLGVEIGERFRIDYPKGMTAWLYINEDGFVERDKGANRLKIGNSVAWAINHPESIIRKPRFTKRDVDDAKAMKRLFPEAAILARGCHGHLIVGNAKRVVMFVRSPEASIFPGIRPGQQVVLNEIIEQSGGEAK